MALLKRRYLFEADDDGGDASSASSDTGNDTSTDNNASDNTDTSSDDNSNDDSSNDNSDDNSDDSSNDDNGDDSGDDEDEDYSIDAEPDEDDDSGDDEGGGDDSGDDEGDEENTDTDSEDKELDRQMFDTLSDSEKKTKINTLKKLFIEMYSNCDNLIDKFNTIQTDAEEDDFAPSVKRVLTILYNLKEYIAYYVVNIFDEKSYIENDITFNRYLTTLNGIKLIAQQLEKIHIQNEEEKNGKK